jgi:fumarylacetoacetate (FAA) hydrolase family protein
MQPGDVVEVEISHIGNLINPVISDERDEQYPGSQLFRVFPDGY